MKTLKLFSILLTTILILSSCQTETELSPETLETKLIRELSSSSAFVETIISLDNYWITIQQQEVNTQAIKDIKKSLMLSIPKLEFPSEFMELEKDQQAIIFKSAMKQVKSSNTQQTGLEKSDPGDGVGACNFLWLVVCPLFGNDAEVCLDGLFKCYADLP